MKRLDIIIPPEHLRDLNKLLYKYNVGGMSFHDVKGRGRTQSEPVTVGYSRITYVPEFGYRTKIEVVVSDLQAENIINEVLEVLGGGAGIIGKIFVFEVVEAHDIPSHEKDDAAL